MDCGNLPTQQVFSYTPGICKRDWNGLRKPRDPTWPCTVMPMHVPCPQPRDQGYRLYIDWTFIPACRFKGSDAALDTQLESSRIVCRWLLLTYEDQSTNCRSQLFSTKVNLNLPIQSSFNTPPSHAQPQLVTATCRPDHACRLTPQLSPVFSGYQRKQSNTAKHSWLVCS
jgi:hypothetical protein